MARIFAIPLVFCVIFLNDKIRAQHPAHFETIHDYVKDLNIGQQSLETFTKEKLIKNSRTEVEKAWAIYVWIANNISYDCRAYHNNNKTKIKYTSEEELANKIARMEEKELRRTIRLKRGICEDYAQLFKAMSEYVGIESEIITGYGRTSYRDIGREHRRANHAWNRFKANGEWYLLDVTWGAGFTDAGVTRFTKEFRPAYFMMKPEDMIKNHYPDKEAWQQLAPELTKSQAANQAIYHYGYWRYGVSALSPNTAFVQGKRISFSVRLEKEVDPGKLAVVQDDLIIHQGFTKSGNLYTADVTLKRRSKKRIMLGLRTGKQKFDTIIEYKSKS